MQSDYYIIMAGPDAGSTNAIQKLNKMVPEWYKNTVTNTFHKVHRSEGTGQLRRQYPFRKKAPKFLGIVLGNWKSTKNNPECNSLVFSKFSQGLSIDMPSNKFKATLSKQWLEAKESLCKLEEFTFKDDCDGFSEVMRFAPLQRVYKEHNLVAGLVGRVRNFAGLKVNSEHFGIPVPFLEDKHLEIEWDDEGQQRKKKNPSTKIKESVQFFRKLYDQIAWNILALIHTDSKSDGRCMGAPAGAAAGPSSPAPSLCPGKPWVDMPADWSSSSLGGPPKPTDNVFLDVIDDNGEDSEE